MKITNNVLLSLLFLTLATCTPKTEIVEPKSVVDTNKLPTKIWDASFDGETAESPGTIISTKDGGYIWVQNIRVNKTPSNSGKLNYNIVKLNKDGVKIWDKNFGGNKGAYPRTILETADGGFVISGITSSGISNDKTEKNEGSADLWILKIDKDGLKIWDRTFGGEELEYSGDVIETKDGSFIVSGSSISTKSGNKSENSKGSYDFWIIKINKDGGIVWDKTIGGDSVDFASKIIATSDNNFLILGYSQSNISSDKTEANKGDYDIWIVKIDNNGKKIWDKTLGGNDIEFAASIKNIANGEFIISGSSKSGISGDKSEKSKGGFDFWILKVASDGKKIWDKTIGGQSDDYSWSKDIITTSDGFIIAGDSESEISGDKSEANKGISDYWIVKLNNNGEKIWDKTLGGNKSDNLYTILSPKENELVTYGFSRSEISSDKTTISNTTSGVWIVKLGFQ